MKTSHRLVLASVIAMWICGCGKDSPDQPDPDNPPTNDYITLTGVCASGKTTVSPEATTILLTFETNEAWTATLPSSVADWCSISPTSGSKGTGSITVSIAENKFYDERNASISIVAGSARKTVVIAQKQRDALLLSSSKVEIDKEGGSFNIEVRSNVDASFKIPTQYSSWLKPADASRSRGLTSKNYGFVVEANPDMQARQAEIEFSAGGLSETVYVYQAGGPDIIVSKPKIYVAASGGDVTVELLSNTDFTYEITEGSDWLHRNISRALSSHTLYFFADPYNNNEVSRVATIQFYIGSSPMSKVTVEQLEKGAIIIGEKTLDVPASGGEYSIQYSANHKMAAKTKSPDWISVGEAQPASRAMEQYSLPVSVKPSYSFEPREGTVVIYEAGDPTVKEELTIRQSGIDFTFTTSLEEGDFLDARSHEFTIDVKSDVEYTMEIEQPLKHIADNRYKIEANHKGSSGSKKCAIKVTAGGILLVQKYVNIAPTYVKDIREDEFSLPAAGGSFSVVIDNNTDISCSIPASAPWITLKSKKITDKGAAADAWFFEVSENTLGTPRSASISFSAGTFWSGTVHVEQKGSASGSSTNTTVTGEGSLAELLGNNLLEVTDLTVAGPLNGKDAGTLHKMAVDGKLTKLDLSGVSFKKDLVNSYGNDYMGKPSKITADDMLGNVLFRKSNIREFVAPRNLKHIGFYTFAESALEKIELPDGLLTIDRNAFYYCKWLKSVNIPGTVADVPEHCFYGNFCLSEVTLGEGVRTISRYAFAPNELQSDKGVLTQIVLPSTLREIGTGAFMSTKLNEITIPADVTKVGDKTFMYCKQLRKAVFECRLDTMPDRMFEMCENLAEIQFPRGLKVIGRYALDHINVYNLRIPEGVTTLMDGALNGASLHGRIELPESLEIIGAHALGWLSLANTFTIPRNVKSIGNHAFDGTCSIKELHIKCPVPPAHDGDIFSSTFKHASCTLYVPKGSAAAYKADSYWLKFKEIIEE